MYSIYRVVLSIHERLECHDESVESIVMCMPIYGVCCSQLSRRGSVEAAQCSVLKLPNLMQQ